MADIKSLQKKAHRRGIGAESENGGYHKHILVCIGDSCAHRKEGAECLKAFRKAAKRMEAESGEGIYATPVECLQLCRNGPLVVIYPEGAWYHSVTPEVAVKLLTDDPETKLKHLLAENPLGG